MIGHKNQTNCPNCTCYTRRLCQLSILSFIWLDLRPCSLAFFRAAGETELSADLVESWIMSQRRLVNTCEMSFLSKKWQRWSFVQIAFNSMTVLYPHITLEIMDVLTCLFSVDLGYTVCDISQIWHQIHTSECFTLFPVCDIHGYGAEQHQRVLSLCLCTWHYPSAFIRSWGQLGGLLTSTSDTLDISLNKHGFSHSYEEWSAAPSTDIQ